MDHLIDLETYPVDQPESGAYLALVQHCRARLATTGMFELPGFFRPEATRQAVETARPLMDTESFRHARRHNVYFRDSVEGLSADHPAMARVDTVHHTLNGAQLHDNPVTELYEWAPFADFLARTMGKPAIHCMDDAVGRVNIQSSREGEALNWHFDQSEFTTTILLQSPEKGGELEYRKDLRSEDAPNYAGVKAVLAGEDPEVRRIALKEGALNVFRGVHTLHRVVPVEGPRERMVAIFSFYDRPGVTMSTKDQIGFYGQAGG